ncbi:MAG TPA: beta-propeller fold lactonase family protein [Verrucomicrobiae bacterium]|nr:beta-propeller fold lactonase family protein [Verrucomicrobiae bacterium]
MRWFYCFLGLVSLSGASCIQRASAPRGHPPESYSTLTPAQPVWPGRKQDGSVLLPNQWSLSPAGKQVELGDFPVNIAVHPSGRFAAVLHSGYSGHDIRVVDITSAKVVSKTPVKESFYGLEFTHDGTRLFCSGAGDEVVHAFDFQDGMLSGHREIRLRPAKERGVPAGLTLDKSARHLFVANVWAHRVTRVELGPKPQVAEILFGPDTASVDSAPTKPSADFDTAAAEKRAEAALYGITPADTYPYTCKLDEANNRLYVSLWGQAEVAVIDLKTSHVLARWPTEEHPCEMALTGTGKRLFVANASRNTVTVFDTTAGKATETIWAALFPKAPRGSTPNSLTLSPDEKTLFVANADNNMVAVFDITTLGKTKSMGFIPVGWYPTSVRVTPDGRRLLVANGKGLSSLPNPQGPQPVKRSGPNRTEEYIGELFHGTLSIIELPPRKAFQEQLAAYTATCYRCSPLRGDGQLSSPPAENNPVPAHPGAPSPIKYCLYVIKENRTYDQILGDMREGNGDPQLCLFPERVTPNFHRLAREFVLFDNFYVDGEVSADGHEWTMGAYATDFVEKMWPMDYGHNGSGKFPYPSEGNFFIAAPAGGYLWDRAREAGVSYRSYGEFISNGRTPAEPSHTRVKALQGHFDERFRGFDLDYPDAKRADRFIAELKRFETEGEMPRLQILRLPNDHTHGTTAGTLTPSAYVADNDLALGRVVEALSHSKFWPQLAIFVVEDDAQNGPDHVDAHRTTAFVISPFTKRAAVDSTLYSTSSMLRTIELILGLKPMSQFDAAARPMFAAFQAAPDLSPYQALPANINLEERNPKQAWNGDLRLNFAKEDAVDDLLLSEMVWRSVKGPEHPMPMPVRAGFFFAHDDRDEDAD